MKTLIMLICLVALAGCTHDPLGQQMKQGPTALLFISEEQALQIAKAENRIEYDRSQPILVELSDGRYIITFPVNKSVSVDIRYRGPAYAARYWIDAKTGEVLQGRLGG